MKKGIFKRKMSFLIIFVVLLITLGSALVFQLKNSHASAAISAITHRPLVNGSTGATLFIPGPTPPTNAQCIAGTAGDNEAIPCLSPQQQRIAYNVTPLINAGFTGKGQTIVIFDAIGDPTIRNDLKAFDKGYNLPDPPSFQVIAPIGTTTFDPTNGDHQAWAFEITLDVEWAHAIAPEANIDLVTSPVDETQGVAGMPELLKVEQYALDHHLGTIFSQSFGTTENALVDDVGGKQVISDYEKFYARAAAEGVSVLASSGDLGTSNPKVDGTNYSFPTVVFPASSPLVTGVGGTSLKTDANGNYQSESVWNNSAISGYAGGGGVSQYFKEPVYQRAILPASDQAILKGMRGVPDVAYSANALTSSVLAYGSFLGRGGWYRYGGTSEGVPQWGGIIAIANQYTGHSQGFLNPLLYLLGKYKNSVFHDVTVGNNAGVNGLPGYNATPGWDPATGWGSPDATAIVHALGVLSHWHCSSDTEVKASCSAPGLAG